MCIFAKTRIKMWILDDFFDMRGRETDKLYCLLPYQVFEVTAIILIKLNNKCN